MSHQQWNIRKKKNGRMKGKENKVEKGKMYNLNN